MLYGEQFGTRPSLSVAAAILRKLRWSITFQELPPNFATFILTKPTAGRQGAATICPPALEPREVPHFPETTSVQQTITPLAGKERPEAQNLLWSAFSVCSTAKLQRLPWPHLHVGIQALASLLLRGAGLTYSAVSVPVLSGGSREHSPAALPDLNKCPVLCKRKRSQILMQDN